MSFVGLATVKSLQKSLHSVHFVLYTVLRHTLLCRKILPTCFASYWISMSFWNEKSDILTDYDTCSDVTYHAKKCFLFIQHVTGFWCIEVPQGVLPLSLSLSLSLLSLSLSVVGWVVVTHRQMLLPAGSDDFAVDWHGSGSSGTLWAGAIWGG